MDLLSITPESDAPGRSSVHFLHAGLTLDPMKSSLCFLVAVCLCVFNLQPLHSAENAAAPGIEGVEWTLHEIHGKPSHAREKGQQTLRLEARKKQALGSGGVNHFFGGYKRTGDRLKFGPLACTEMAGPPAEMKAEAAYFGALAEVSHWRMNEGALELLKDRTVLLRFIAAKAAKK